MEERQGLSIPSILDVARIVEVSPRTVSRVLNNDPKVSSRTRKAVLRAIEEMGYVPNQAARSLRASRSHTLGLVLLDFDNLAMLRLLPGMEGVAQRRGYSLLVCDSRSDPAIEAINVRRFYERRVEGLIIFSTSAPGPELAAFAKSGIPHLVLHVGGQSYPEGVLSVRLCPELGLKAALGNLATFGHRRVTVVNAPTFPSAPIDRKGDAGSILLDYPYFELMIESPEDCAPAIASLLALPDRPTAIVCFVHSYAPYVLEAINASGTRVPDELSFVVMGGSTWVRATRPPLTTILFDFPRLGALAAEYLFSRIDGGAGEEQLAQIRTLVVPELVIRGSCAAVPPSIG